MKTMQIVIEGISEAQIQNTIEKNTRGWWLFFEEPSGADFQFISPFWGFHWDGTAENLKEIILRGARVKDKVKQHICVFKYNGIDRFAWCSWTKQVYDFDTKKYYQLEGDKMAMKITSIINNIMRDPDVEEIY
jgi:hypothetical protein